MPGPWGRLAAYATLAGLLTMTLTFAQRALVFGGLREGERRYIAVGEFVADHLPGNGAIFAVQHSGSLRFYSGRPTFRFDWVQKEWAALVPAAIERSGYHPYLIVDDWEIPQVRIQFGFQPDARLPWPVVAGMRELGGITVFDLATSPAPAKPIVLEPTTRHWCARARPPT
jgi:hypothetical protein